METHNFGPQKGPSSSARIKAQHKQTLLDLSEMHAFITGSYAYGTPTETSDVDLVVYCDDPNDLSTIKLNFGNKQSQHMLPIRAGNLNIINCETPEEWSIWKYGTELLKRRADQEGRSICKEEASELFDSLKRTLDIKSTGNFSGKISG